MRTLGGWAIALVLWLAPSAQATVRFISTAGNDAAPCTLAAPCETLKRGVAETPSGGELRILDSGSYGPPVTIRKSLTVSGQGNTIVLTGAGSITVTGATIAVTLRDLTLDGRNVATSGIIVTAARGIHIIRCEIEQFTSHGILIAPTVYAEVYVTESISRNNGGDGLRTEVSYAKSLTVDDSHFESNAGDGLHLEWVLATITRTVSSGNGGDGIEQLGSSNLFSVRETTLLENGNGYLLSGGKATLESCTLVANFKGLVINAGATARISNSSFTDGGTGIQNNGSLQTIGNNIVSGNNSDVTGAGGFATIGF